MLSDGIYQASHFRQGRADQISLFSKVTYIGRNQMCFHLVMFAIVTVKNDFFFYFLIALVRPTPLHRLKSPGKKRIIALQNRIRLERIEIK